MWHIMVWLNTAPLTLFVDKLNFKIWRYLSLYHLGLTLEKIMSKKFLRKQKINKEINKQNYSLIFLFINL